LLNGSLREPPPVWHRVGSCLSNSLPSRQPSSAISSTVQGPSIRPARSKTLRASPALRRRDFVEGRPEGNGGVRKTQAQNDGCRARPNSPHPLVSGKSC